MASNKVSIRCSPRYPFQFSDWRIRQRDKDQASEAMRKAAVQITALEEQIRKEQKREEEDTQGKRDETRRQLDEVMAKLSAAEARLQEIQNEGNQVQDESRKAGADLDRIKREGEQLKADIQGAEEQLRYIAARERSKLAPFGKDMEQVLSDIEHSRWMGERPVGPLGRFVKVRDPQHWGDVMRVQIGNMMSAFAITDPRDRQTLERILKNRGK